jgi:predicted dehydrogenase
VTRIPIAVVGLNFGRLMLKQLQEEPASRYFEIAAVCDLDREKVQKTAQELGVKAFHELDALLADRDIPSIGLFTGPMGRAGLLRKIILAGKDVMTTKPFEVDAMAADAILREAIQLGRVIHLNSPAPLYSQDLDQITHWREEYDLGRPIGARADAWAAYVEAADGSWYDDPSRCPVAPVFRLGIYLINDLIDLYGPVDAVQVFHSRVLTGRPTPDNAQLCLRFKNGALANIYNSFCIHDGQFFRNTLTLNYERGTIYRNVPPAFHLGHNHYDCNLMLVTRKAEKPVVRRRRRVSLSGTYQWQAFHRAISGHKRSRDASVEYLDKIVEGLKVIAAMSRAEVSGQTELI